MTDTLQRGHAGAWDQILFGWACAFTGSAIAVHEMIGAGSPRPAVLALAIGLVGAPSAMAIGRVASLPARGPAFVVAGLSDKNVAVWYRYAFDAYVFGELEVWEFEAALDHIRRRLGPIGPDGRPIAGEFEPNETGGFKRLGVAAPDPEVVAAKARQLAELQDIGYRAGWYDGRPGTTRHERR